MTVTVFIRYQLDPFKRAMFEQYAKRWLTIIPKCGGDLIGYWMPHEGTNNIAFALISFENLAAYENYRVDARAPAEATRPGGLGAVFDWHELKTSTSNGRSRFRRPSRPGCREGRRVSRADGLDVSSA